jgi:hypothetical protein
MEKSENINELAAALAKAQAELKNPPRSREVSVRMKSGGTYKFRYAPLEDILEMARPILSKNGLAITHLVGGTELKICLLHESGQYIESTVPLRPAEAGPQAFGSEITYKRRYTVTAMLGISADDDEDGNLSNGNGFTAKPPSSGSNQPNQPQPSSEPPKIDGITYRQVEGKQGQPILLAEGNGTNGKNAILKGMGFAFHPDKKVWWKEL